MQITIDTTKLSEGTTEEQENKNMELDTQKAERMLAVLDGKPPFDRPDNICRNDAILARNIEREFGMTVAELRYCLQVMKEVS